MQQYELTRVRNFSRRVALLAGVKLMLLSLVGGQLYNLQVRKREKYRTKADENRINVRLLAPLRGRIYDRGGTLIALNKQNYRLVLVPEQAGNIRTILQTLSATVPLRAADHQRIMDEIAHRRSFIPITVREHLSWAQVAQIEYDAPYLPGVSIESGEIRQYPFGATFAHLVGYVGLANAEEISGEPLLQLPGFSIGKNGVEKMHDLNLRGRAGNVQVEVNAHGRVIRELDRSEGSAGEDVVLTVDAGLQQYVAGRLGAESASAAVLDVTTGECLSVASTPSFDPNSFIQGLTTRQWGELVNNHRAPLINKAISGRYPPGSVFKLVVALAALESGLVDSSHRVRCIGHVKLGNKSFHCWRKGGHGRLAMTAAIAQSCDVYFYDLALKIGVERIAEMALRLGFGKISGFDLPGEQGGLVPTPDWKRALYDERWQKGDTLNTAIGQGYLSATTLQLAVMTARLVNGGRAVAPHLTKSVGGQVNSSSASKAAPQNLGFSHESLSILKRGMEQVVNDVKGTAYSARIEEARFAMGGKTGTSQVRSISSRERETGVKKNEERPWADRDHALFVGYAPISDPRYAAAVIVEHGGSGSKIAAPMVHDILLEAQRIDPLSRTAFSAHSSQAG